MPQQDDMKILTLGVSPFYFTRNAKIHDSIIRNVSDTSDGTIELSSVFLDHDIEYFPQESIKSRYNGIDAKFYSTCAVADQLVTSVFDIIEIESPDVVLSIGSFPEFEYIRAIKRVIPDAFNWVIVLASNIDHRFSEFSETLQEANHVICLTKQSHLALKNYNIDCSLFEYGIDNKYFSEIDSSPKDPDCPIFIINDKNVQQSNLALVLDTFSMLKDENFKLILHTNYYESGDYNLDSLISKFHTGQIELPSDFVGLKEGLSEDGLIEKYSRAHFVVDLSIKPITSLCVLEGMSLGCVPIINSSGCLYEKLMNNKEYSDLEWTIVDSNLFFGEHLEPFYMASQDSFFYKINKALRMINENIDEYNIMSELSRSMSIQSSSKGFCRNISNLIMSNDAFNNTTRELKLKVETF